MFQWKCLFFFLSFMKFNFNVFNHRAKKQKKTEIKTAHPIVALNIMNSEMYKSYEDADSEIAKTAFV